MALFPNLLDKEAEDHIKDRINTMVINKGDNFANAREIRNHFEGIITRQAKRISTTVNLSDTEMLTIEVNDV